MHTTPNTLRPLPSEALQSDSHPNYIGIPLLTDPKFRWQPPRSLLSNTSQSNFGLPSEAHEQTDSHPWFHWVQHPKAFYDCDGLAVSPCDSDYFRCAASWENTKYVQYPLDYNALGDEKARYENSSSKSFSFTFPGSPNFVSKK
jgi:hypothetical protein